MAARSGPRRQPQGAVDGLGTTVGVAALLLDDGLAHQRPMIGRGQAVPAGEEGHGPIHVATTVVQARQPIVSGDARRVQAEQHLDADCAGSWCPDSSCAARALQQERFAVGRVTAAEHARVLSRRAQRRCAPGRRTRRRRSSTAAARSRHGQRRTRRRCGRTGRDHGHCWSRGRWPPARTGRRAAAGRRRGTCAAR